MKQLSVLIFIFTFLCLSCYAQETCKVLQTSIAGNYTGDCAGSLAHGKGKAVGRDTYEGDFSRGYAHGAGTYTWQNGTYYKGAFKKGKITGMGAMHYPRMGSRDTVIIGFWKNGSFQRRYEVPFKILTNDYEALGVKAVLVRKVKANGFIRILTVNSVVLSDVAVSEGQYGSISSTSTPYQNVGTLHQIEFPLKAKFTFSNGGVFEVIFYERGDYEVRFVRIRLGGLNGPVGEAY